MASRRNRLWGTTAYGPYKIKIYINPRITTMDGYTNPRTEGITIELAEGVLDDPVRLDETLMHEFVHVLEFLNAPEAFSTVPVNNCTALAQTMGKGLTQLLRELTVAPPPRKRQAKPRT